MTVSKHRETFELRQRLRSSYISLDRDDAFEEALTEVADRILMKRNPERPWGDGNRVEQILVSLVGKPGAGKSTLLDHGLADHSYFNEALAEKGGIVLEVETPATPSIRSLAAATLTKAAPGLSMPRIGNRSDLWRDAKALLTKCNTRVVIFNEFQNLLKPDAKETAEELLSNLRSLLIYPDNPMAIIAVGQESMAQAIALDGSVERRTRHVPLRSLSQLDFDSIKETIDEYFFFIDFSPDDEFKDWFTPRLMHSANYQFGLLCEYLTRLCEYAIVEEKAALDRNDIILHYERTFKNRKTEENPFFVENWQSIDMSFLEDPHTKHERRQLALADSVGFKKGKAR